MFIAEVVTEVSRPRQSLQLWDIAISLNLAESWIGQEKLSNRIARKRKREWDF